MFYIRLASHPLHLACKILYASRLSSNMKIMFRITDVKVTPIFLPVLPAPLYTVNIARVPSLCPIQNSLFLLIQPSLHISLNSSPALNISLGRPRRGWEYNIKMDLRERGVMGRTGFSWLRIGSSG
jgi:hypothetical protein